MQTEAQQQQLLLLWEAGG